MSKLAEDIDGLPGICCSVQRIEEAIRAGGGGGGRCCALGFHSGLAVGLPEEVDLERPSMQDECFSRPLISERVAEIQKVIAGRRLGEGYQITG